LTHGVRAWLTETEMEKDRLRITASGCSEMLRREAAIPDKRRGRETFFEQIYSSHVIRLRLPQTDVFQSRFIFIGILFHPRSAFY
jgi:hypothetical protein